MGRNKKQGREERREGGRADFFEDLPFGQLETTRIRIHGHRPTITTVQRILAVGTISMAAITRSSVSARGHSLSPGFLGAWVWPQTALLATTYLLELTYSPLHPKGEQTEAQTITPSPTAYGAFAELESGLQR